MMTTEIILGLRVDKRYMLKGIGMKRFIVGLLALRGKRDIFIFKSGAPLKKIIRIC
ncbi:hypothetical protein GCM10010913_47210 [Paenibacillus aceti]|uniref:Transposase n=1 Tax=Paenibacillus aceti TaxID=1820010 RepID=A0ABQ1W936_9BACL|nr:hypothetical protein GCM10010913_47210 [Paenibacillus aceti]